MDLRVRSLNPEPRITGGRYVLYWMRANRRAEFNHALAFAASLANDRDLPLLCLDTIEPINDRFYTFVLNGVAETARRIRSLGAGYVFQVEHAQRDTIARLAADAAVVVTDDYPVLADPPEAHYAVDSSCIVPMAAIPEKQYAAYAIRPKIRKLLDRYLAPMEPVRLRRRFRGAEPESDCDPGPIDRTIPPVTSCPGGVVAANERLEHFLAENLHRYARHRNEPSTHTTSGLSPYLHFGYISSLEVALRVKDYAARHKLIADEFLEQLIVRRELSFNFARYARRIDSLDELPEWVQATLRKHARDDRPWVYTREQFTKAATHDPLWNATQREMLHRGVIHGYYRMYWGKKLLEWSASYEDALATALYIHDRYALDGRDPNTYAGILWCFGLHDRPWPERPIYGQVRSMTREGAERKTNVAAYLREVEELCASH